uniref:Uncharacterized protein n=1 Tax=Oryza rufipogon TaxID=4529 RepID=A0A0E0R2E7_ORYRU
MTAANWPEIRAPFLNWPCDEEQQICPVQLLLLGKEKVVAKPLQAIGWDCHGLLLLQRESEEFRDVSLDLLQQPCIHPMSGPCDSDGNAPFHYAVCNPATKKWVMLPKANWASDSSYLEDHPIACLGFDPAISSHFHVLEYLEVHPECNLIFFHYGLDNNLLAYEMDRKELHVVRNLGHHTCQPVLPYVPLFSVPPEIRAPVLHWACGEEEQIDPVQLLLLGEDEVVTEPLQAIGWDRHGHLLLQRKSEELCNVILDLLQQLPIHPMVHKLQVLHISEDY